MNDVVVQAQEALGARLRELRRPTGLNGKDFAAACGWHPTKVSQLERGRRPPSEDDLRAWTRVCGNPLVLDDLVATLRNLRSMYLEWRRVLAGGHAHGQRQLAQAEHAARHIRWYEDNLIPGLLQTESYARAALIACRSVLPGLLDDTDTAVTLRMRNRGVLRTGNRRFAFVLNAAALHRVMGSPAVMVEQLDQLVDDADNPRISLGVIPLDALWPCPAHGFTLFDRATATVETIAAELAVTRPSEIAIYEDSFRQLDGIAVHGAAAADLIAGVRDRHARGD